MKIESFMTGDVFTVSTEMTVREAIKLVTEKHISGAPVVDSLQKLITVLSEGDLLKLSAAVGLDKTIATCLNKLQKTEKIITLTKGDAFKDAYRIFLTNSIHRIIIIDGNGKVQGIVSRSNILRLLVESKKVEEAANAVKSESAAKAGAPAPTAAAAGTAAAPAATGAAPTAGAPAPAAASAADAGKEAVKRGA